ncbi:hypothetical protein [Motilimonas eburnea]|uniref:hypothetical protein n=1 Tax=Motilimonas eburnea TaxID=1737488 RepID=UPI001E54CD23|nr:hypothetical protein [Motilimonas eburnea]MCE2571613.1 hypothetical protein [Motilimonas eburnea]
MNNKRYRVTYFDQDGCKEHMTIETPYYICRDHDTALCLFDEQGCVGDEALLESMLNQNLNGQRACCIVNAEPLLI